MGTTWPIYMIYGAVALVLFAGVSSSDGKLSSSSPALWLLLIAIVVFAVVYKQI